MTLPHISTTKVPEQMACVLVSPQPRSSGVRIARSAPYERRGALGGGCSSGPKESGSREPSLRAKKEQPTSS